MRFRTKSNVKITPSGRKAFNKKCNPNLVRKRIDAKKTPNRCFTVNPRRID